MRQAHRERMLKDRRPRNGSENDDKSDGLLTHTYTRNERGLVLVA
jgi:hypothetical protein